MNCPICNKSTHFLTAKKDRFARVYKYEICENCRFIFEQNLVLDTIGLQKKVSDLYKSDYFDKIDVGWQGRCDGFLKIIKKIIRIYGFSKNKKDISVLDYGGGNGYLASKLYKDFNTFYYDKYEKPTFLGEYKILEQPKKADIIYAVELVEHLTDIKEWEFLKELMPNVFVFTTGLSDNINNKEIANWQYINSDGGHTALYSSKSLYFLGKKYGFIYFFFPSISCHIFIKNKFLSKINFVFFEYSVYNVLRIIKKLLKNESIF